MCIATTDTGDKVSIADSVESATSLAAGDKEISHNHELPASVWTSNACCNKPPCVNFPVVLNRTGPSCMCAPLPSPLHSAPAMDEASCCTRPTMPLSPPCRVTCRSNPMSFDHACQGSLPGLLHSLKIGCSAFRALLRWVDFPAWPPVEPLFRRLACELLTLVLKFFACCSRRRTSARSRCPAGYVKQPLACCEHIVSVLTVLGLSGSRGLPSIPVITRPVVLLPCRTCMAAAAAELPSRGGMLPPPEPLRDSESRRGAWELEARADALICRLSGRGWQAPAESMCKRLWRRLFSCRSS